MASKAMTTGDDFPGGELSGDRPDGATALSTLSFCIAADDGRLLNPMRTIAPGSLPRPDECIQDRYRLQAELGRGGMGCVYLARDERLDRLVAIKVVAPSRRSSHGPLDDALAHEARLGAGLNHPAVAAVYDFGFHGGRAFTVFEYVDGDALREILQRRGRMELGAVRSIVGSLARALDFAHGKGIVHRDLKPENIRASRQGQFKILDLGLAQEFRRKQDWTRFAGTPAYASPEQAAGLPTDGRTDQYALSVIAYEMLVGRRPFAHDDPWRLLDMHRTESPSPPETVVQDLPAFVGATIMRALSKDPHDRFSSCEEFAASLGWAEVTDQRHRLPVDQDQADHLHLYICHASENSPMARQLARAMEARGFSCWHYEHDALPGISFVKQTSEAIRRADAFLLMISDQAINSPDVRREIQEAHHLGRPILPVLLGLARQEFQQRQPDWQPMIGSAAMTTIRSGDLKSAIDRLVKTLEVWSIEARRWPGRAPSADSPRGPSPAPADRSRKIWASDANQIEVHELKSVVFRNEMVDEFLERRNKYFLSASKGLGKTLLLTFKRLLLSRAFRDPGGDEPAGVVFVPRGRPYLDFMSDVRSLSKQHVDFVSDLLNDKRLWSMALGVSALSHHPGVMTPDDQEEIALFPRRVRSWIEGAAIEPTVVFKELLTLSVRDINRLIDHAENFLDHKLRQVHGGTFFFIDKVDQALRQVSQQAWVHVQAGLIEAAWDLMNANSHVKVHASIRQEAFSNYESDIKANLFGATTLIRYSETDLRQMLDQLARCYEDCESFQDFISLNVVKHPRRPFPEDSFRYVRRHTLGRPRDLVIIASELSAKRRTMNETRFRDLVNETSAIGLVANVFDEMRVFLNCLRDKNDRQRFLGLIPHNILTHEEAVGICCLFNGLSADDYEYYRENAEGLHHPFCDLYRVGLLGTLAREPDGSRLLQTFRQPHDYITDMESALPRSSHYLLHPALDDHIARLRVSGKYHLFQHVAVGDGQLWEEYFHLFCNVERCLFSIDDADVREATYRLLSDARLVLTSDRRAHLRSVLEASSDMKLLRETRRQDARLDELNYWLDELVGY